MKNIGKIILASKSPRRRELLQLLEIPFEVLVSDEEEVITSTNPAQVTEELASQKAMAVARKLDEGIVIGADTVVSVDGQILGKPKDKEDAKKMISLLQGRSHMVTTGVSLVDATGQQETICFHVGTKVKVASMTALEIEDYINSEEPYDKAGSYGIQGIFSKYIEGIEGDYFNVVGLPVHALYSAIKVFAKTLDIM